MMRATYDAFMLNRHSSWKVSIVELGLDARSFCVSKIFSWLEKCGSHIALDRDDDLLTD
jgi:hypothetical protein